MFVYQIYNICYVQSQRQRSNFICGGQFRTYSTLVFHWKDSYDAERDLLAIAKLLFRSFSSWSECPKQMWINVWRDIEQIFFHRDVASA